MGNRVTVDSFIDNPNISDVCIYFKEPDLHVKENFEADILKIQSFDTILDDKKFIVFYNTGWNEIYKCFKNIKNSNIDHSILIFAFLRPDGYFNLYDYNLMYKILKNKLIMFDFYYYHLHKLNYVYSNNTMIYYSCYGRFSFILYVDIDPYKNIIPFSN